MGSRSPAVSDGHIDNRYRPAAAAAGCGGAFIIETETIANISTGHGDTFSSSSFAKINTSLLITVTEPFYT